MSKYHADVRYIPRESNVIADALSRVCFRETPAPDSLKIEVNTITQHLPATSAKLQEILQATLEDATLCHLKDVIFDGWPAHMKDCSNDLKPYWNFREDVSIENGLVLKGLRLVIPEQLRPGMLELIHQGHFGQQQKQPLQQHSAPSYPRQKVASDLFDYKGSVYLLLADYYSKFPIVRKLTSSTSAAIINHLKSIFAEHGMPETLVSDNGLQYASAEFKQFCSVWNVSHNTSSPSYPRSNGFIERMVQTRSLVSDGHHEQLLHRQQVQKLQHDSKSARNLPELYPGQPVAVLEPRSKVWKPATVCEKRDEPRSYTVKTSTGSELRCIPHHETVYLKPHPGIGPQVTKQTSMERPQQVPSPKDVPATATPIDNKDCTVTRSGREVKPPQKLDL
eukprot:gene13263-14630_t